MTMPDEIWAIDEEIDNDIGARIYPATWSENCFTYGTEYIRKDIHKEKMEVLKRIITARDATIKQLERELNEKNIYSSNRGTIA